MKAGLAAERCNFETGVVAEDGKREGRKRLGFQISILSIGTSRFRHFLVEKEVVEPVDDVADFGKEGPGFPELSLVVGREEDFLVYGNIIRLKSMEPITLVYP